MTYKGIIFDFNGVLLWDALWHEQSWQGIAQRLRGRAMTQDELETRMHGRPNADVLAYLAGRPIIGEELADLIQAKESIYRELCLMNPHRFVLSPGAEELLGALVKSDIARTIATSSEITNVRFFIENLHLAHWFDIDRIVYDDGVRPGKPAPDIYLEAAAQIGVPVGECIVIEDARSGLAAAHAAGAGCLIALGRQEAHEELSRLPGVSLAIQSLRDFPRDLLWQ